MQKQYNLLFFALEIPKTARKNKISKKCDIYARIVLN
jgi:hypothetical protein